MDINRYRIGELAEKAGVTKRTIHYYLGRGLLPPSNGEGLGTTYTDEHLFRIMLVKKLQDEYLPLDEIRKRIAGMTLEDVKQYLNGALYPLQLFEHTSQYSGTQDNYPEGSPGGTSIHYERVSLGYGLEIHIPENNEKARKMADILVKYADKIMKEG